MSPVMTTQSQLPFFSVVIATYNGASTIGRTIASVEAQTYPRDHYEIIVVDDGSTEDIAAAVSAYDVRYVRQMPNAGVAAARNRGLAEATGDVFAGLDDDCIAEPGWLAELAAGYEYPDAIGVGGVLAVPTNLNGLLDRYLAAAWTGAPAARHKRRLA